MGRLAKIAYGLTFGALVVSWIVLLSGNGTVACVLMSVVRCTLGCQALTEHCTLAPRCSGALNAVCYDSCRYYFGLSW